MFRIHIYHKIFACIPRALWYPTIVLILIYIFQRAEACAYFQTLWFVFSIQKHAAMCSFSPLHYFMFSIQKYVAIPYTSAGSKTYSSCQMYDLEYDNLTIDDFLHWNRSVHTNHTNTIHCQSWQYNKDIYVQNSVSKVRTTDNKDHWIDIN